VILTFKKDDNGQLVQYTGFLTDDKIDKGGKTPYERSLDSLHVVGFSGDDLDAFNDQTPHGRARISTEIEEYNGTRRERVRFVNPEAFAMVDGDRMSATDLKKFSAKAKADKQRRASAPAFNPNGPDPDDNVNF
jgi:hypothetical protein